MRRPQLMDCLGLALMISLVGASRVSASAPSLEWKQSQRRAEVAARRGDLKGAAESLRQAYGIARRDRHAAEARRTLRWMKQVYTRLGDTARAEKAEALSRRLSQSQPSVKLTSADVERALAMLQAEKIPEALKLLEQTVAAEVPAGLRTLGSLYVEGRHLEVQAAKGVALVQKAADAGDVPALVYLAELVELGIGVPVDMGEARSLYRRAAEAGDAGAAQAYARLLGPFADPSEIEVWLTKAAKGGWISAQVELGVRLYVQGERDVEAVAWFTKAAEAGDAEGWFNLGLCRLYGRGVPADEKAAVEAFRQGSDSGSAAAVQALAALGVVEDEESAGPRAD